MSKNKITLRPIRPEDEGFLIKVYGSTREEELVQTGWDRHQKDQFIHFQFIAQHTYYQQEYAKAEYDIILCGRKQAGRLYVDRREKEIRIVDIALLPEFRNQGIGGKLLRDLLDEGRKTGKEVRIHVESNNPALALYTRLGFKRIGESGVYFLMAWTP